MISSGHLRFSTVMELVGTFVKYIRAKLFLKVPKAEWKEENDIKWEESKK